MMMPAMTVRWRVRHSVRYRDDRWSRRHDGIGNALRHLRDGIQDPALAALIVVLGDVRIVCVVLSKHAKTGRARIATEIVHVGHGGNGSGGTEIPPVRLPGRKWQKLVMVMMVTMVGKPLTAVTSKFGHAVLPKLFG